MRNLDDRDEQTMRRARRGRADTQSSNVLTSATSARSTSSISLPKAKHARGHFHFRVKSVNRAQGRSAVAAAAYRAGVELADQRTGQVHDYTRKQGVEHREIVLPVNAPQWAADRAQLWNAAEQAENRKNSTVAREFEIALPAQVNSERRRAMVHEFAREISDKHGVAVDVAIHEPGREGDQRNYHAHLLLTTRRLGPEGLGEKTRELDNKNSGEIERWRERWADIQNRELERAGAAERVDHRSYQRQGVNRDPLPELDRSQYQRERVARKQAERKGVPYEPVTKRGKQAADVQERNQLRRDMAKEAAGARFAQGQNQPRDQERAAWSAIGKADRQQRGEEQQQQRERAEQERVRQAERERQRERERERVAERLKERARDREGPTR